ncbi:hypothetical protein J6590_060921 [Homalodisca vitripennis]|nr:hypothetical protein J6590_060921 [Homalodisca vitripennis]
MDSGHDGHQGTHNMDSGHDATTDTKAPRTWTVDTTDTRATTTWTVDTTDTKAPTTWTVDTTDTQASNTEGVLPIIHWTGEVSTQVSNVLKNYPDGPQVVVRNVALTEYVGRFMAGVYS